MMRVRYYGLLLCLVFVTSISSAAQELPKNKVEKEEVATEATSTPSNILSFGAKQADWVFAGSVNNESGEQYNFFFQLQRNNHHFHAIATLIEEQTSKVVIFEESDGDLEDSESSQWQVGRSFLRFNAINNSWVFGVKSKDKKGFNFKVDMLGHTDNDASQTQDIRNGLVLLINQTGRLNGHLQLGKDIEEQFVTAKKAWFRRMWVSKPQDNGHPLTAVLCQFNDGGGFYFVNMKESDALRGAVAGWRDNQGTAVPMSQFVTVKQDKDGIWKIHIPSPRMELTFKDLLGDVESKHLLVLGMVKGVMPGFCSISMYEIGQQTENPV